jgi:hypothetical protein
VKASKQPKFTEMDEAQLEPQLLDRCAEDRFFACETFLKVSNKDGVLVPCKIRELIQRHYEASGEVSIWLKSRQEFLTTSIDALFYQDMVEGEGVKVLALNLNEEKATENFRRVLNFEDNRHPALKELSLSIRNSEEIGYRETRGTFKTATIKNDSTAAQADLIARSGTYHRVRFTEGPYSRHYKVIKKAVLDTMPRTNRKFVSEGTGNGAVGGFYEDFMEVVTHGRPHPTLANCWVSGNVTAHFLAWFQHHEYQSNLPPFQLENLPLEVQRVLLEYEADHVEEMQAFGFSPEEINARLNWRRAVLLDEKNLLSDPVGACRNMNREYPATYRHAFQATGQAWFNLQLVDSLRDFYKKEGERLGLPVFLDFIHEKGALPTPVKGTKFQVFEMPVRGWKYRYCGFLDPSAGHDGGDATAFLMIDRVLLKVAMVFHGPYAPREAAGMMMTSGVWYDYAYLNWENDGLGLGVTEALVDGGYTNLYLCEPNRIDLGRYGWNTGPESRKVMTARGKTYFEHPHTPIRNPYVPFYTEAGSFQVQPGRTKPEAVSGHDDLVMAFCGAVMTHLSMPNPEPPSREQTMKPGEVGVNQLAGVTAGYRAAAQKRSNGFRNFGRRD